MTEQTESWADILARAKNGADELRQDGQAAVWIRGEADDNAAKAERIEGQVAAGYGEASDNDVAVALTELAEAHRAAAELLKRWAERSARKHREEPETSDLAKRIGQLKAAVDSRARDAEYLRERGRLVPVVMQEATEVMRRDIAWLEELQRLSGGNDG